MTPEEFETYAHGVRKLMLAKCYGVLGNSDDAEDATQEAMLKLWGARDKFDDLASPQAFAVTVARNCAVSMLRSRHIEADIDNCGVAPLSPFEADDEMLESDNELTISTILAHLPSWQQTILRMRHIDGYEIDEIARKLACSNGNVRSTLSRARCRVKDLFNELNGRL